MALDMKVLTENNEVIDLKDLIDDDTNDYPSRNEEKERIDDVNLFDKQEEAEEEDLGDDSLFEDLDDDLLTTEEEFSSAEMFDDFEDLDDFNDDEE